MASERTVQKIYSEALRQLDEFDYGRALKLGKKLRKWHHSSGFEIVARAYVGLDRLPEAISVLEEGVRHVPDVVDLWEQLGCYYSDAERFSDALVAFKNARNLAGNDTGWIDLNRAIVLNRQGQDEKALSLLDDLADCAEPHPLIIAELRVRILNGLSRFEEATRHASGAIQAFDELEDSARLETGHGVEHIDQTQLLAWIHSARGKAHWVGFRDRDLALADAWRAIEINRADERAAWLVRDIENLRSEASTYYRLLVEGRWNEPLENGEPLPGFFCSYDVVASNPDEALGFIRRFEPEAVRSTLRIDEASVLEPRTGEPKGVYEVTGRHFFVPDG